MYEFLITLAVILVMFVVGEFDGSSNVKRNYQNACVVKYGDMPANKVEDFCSTLLKFEK